MVLILPEDVDCGGGGPPSHSARAGSALVVVLWVVGLLSMFVLAFAFDMHIESRITSSWRRKLQAEYLARAGIELARMTMLSTTDPELKTTEPELYVALGGDEALRSATLALSRGGAAELHRELGDGTVAVLILPENARINLKTLINITDRELTYENMTPLFENAGVPWDMRDELVDSLMDWMDQDELVRLSGAESSYYERLSPPYKAKNRMLDTVDELVLVKGFNSMIPDTEITVYDAISGFLTTYSKDRKININAVDVETLMAFLNIDAQLAEQIIAARAGPDGIEGTADDTPFESIEDLLQHVPILNGETAGDYITTEPMGRFMVKSRGQIKDITRQINCVIEQEGDKLSVLSWMEGEPPRSRE